jgi:hypothetical protein
LLPELRPRTVRTRTSSSTRPLHPYKEKKLPLVVLAIIVRS